MDPPTPPDLMGANLKLTLIKYSQEGTEIRKVVPITVAGVLVEDRGEPDYTMYMSIEDVTAYNEWAMDAASTATATATTWLSSR